MKLPVITALVLITNLSYSASARAADPEKFTLYGRYDKACDVEPTELLWKSFSKSAVYNTLPEANDLCGLAVDPLSEPNHGKITTLFHHFDADQRKCEVMVRIEYTCPPVESHPTSPDAVFYRNAIQTPFCANSQYDESVWLSSYNAQTDDLALKKAQKLCADQGRPNVEQLGPIARVGQLIEFPDQGQVEIPNVCSAHSTIKFRCRK